MKNLTHSLILAMAMLMLPAMCHAQETSLPVKIQGGKVGIKDFARAYCSPCQSGTMERIALAAWSKGNYKNGNSQSIVDVKNGYLMFTQQFNGMKETIEMCYWNCDNKNEKIVAVNNISNSIGMDESILIFYRYNVKTKTMTLIDAPFDHTPAPIDLVDRERADKATIDMVRSAKNEDSNKYQPFYQLPRNGKDIKCRMADPNAIPKQFQNDCELEWNGNGFTFDD